MTQEPDVISFLEGLADTLDEWAERSIRGGWSTHQVEANRAAANECRRMAAQLRKLRPRTADNSLVDALTRIGWDDAVKENADDPGNWPHVIARQALAGLS